MSFEVAPIIGRIGFDEKPALDAFKRTEKGAVDFKRNTEAQFGQAGQAGGKAFFKGLSSEFGKKSNLAQGLKLAMGGGAIAGINMATHFFEEFTDGIAKTATSLRDADSHWQDVLSDFLRGLPIVGSVVKGFDNLREAVSGEREELEKTAAVVKRLNDAEDFRKEMIKEGKAATQEWTEKIRELRKEFELLATTPSGRSDMKATQAVEDKLHGFQQEFLKETNPVDKAGRSGLDIYTRYQKAIKERDDLLQPMRDASKTVESARTGQFSAFPTQLHAAKDVVARWTEASLKAQELREELDGIYAATAAANKGYDEATGQLFKNQDKAADEARIDAQNKANMARASKESAYYADRLAGRWEEIKNSVGKSAEQVKDMYAKGKDLTRELRTPGQVLSDSLRETRGRNNIGAIGNETAAREAMKAIQAYQQAMGPLSMAVNASEIRHAGLSNNQMNNPLAKLPELAQKQLDAMLKNNATLEKMVTGQDTETVVDY